MFDDNEAIVDEANIGLSKDLVTLPEYKIPGRISLDFDGLLKTPLLLYEDASEGCGGHTWPAGMVLAKYLLREPQLGSLRGKRILELGAGSGLVGLAVARALCASAYSNKSSAKIQITDQLAMLPLMQHNIELNGFPSSLISATVLDWGEPAYDQCPPDVILAAECVYFEPAFPLLLQTLTELIGRDTVCYFCFKKRRRADAKFVKDAKKRLHVGNIMDDPEKRTWSRENLFL